MPYIEISIGKYCISWDDGKLWMTIIEGENEGEGMEISEVKLEMVLDQFYEDNF